MLKTGKTAIQRPDLCCSTAGVRSPAQAQAAAVCYGCPGLNLSQTHHAVALGNNQVVLNLCWGLINNGCIDALNHVVVLRVVALCARYSDVQVCSRQLAGRDLRQTNKQHWQQQDQANPTRKSVKQQEHSKQNGRTTAASTLHTLSVALPNLN